MSWIIFWGVVGYVVIILGFSSYVQFGLKTAIKISSFLLVFPLGLYFYFKYVPGAWGIEAESKVDSIILFASLLVIIGTIALFLYNLINKKVMGATLFKQRKKFSKPQYFLIFLFVLLVLMYGFSISLKLSFDFRDLVPLILYLVIMLQSIWIGTAGITISQHGISKFSTYVKWENIKKISWSDNVTSELTIHHDITYMIGDKVRFSFPKSKKLEIEKLLEQHLFKVNNQKP